MAGGPGGGPCVRRPRDPRRGSSLGHTIYAKDEGEGTRRREGGVARRRRGRECREVLLLLRFRYTHTSRPSDSLRALLLLGP